MKRIAIRMYSSHCVFALLATTIVTARAADLPTSSAPNAPAYTSDGRLELPANYREWIYLSSGLDMSYSKGAGMPGHSMFDNVFVTPVAYRAFQRDGRWPEATVLLMEVRGASVKGSINQSGKYQSGEPMGLEVHVKDSARFKGGWGFFAFDSAQPAVQIPVAADCYSCHLQHGAVDTTFVQFYPTLIDLATRKRTLSEAYLREQHDGQAAP